MLDHLREALERNHARERTIHEGGAVKVDVHVVGDQPPELVEPRRSQHRYLFNKAALIREASAACVQAPKDGTKRAYLRGLADACHGTTDAETAQAIHVARCVIQATTER